MQDYINMIKRWFDFSIKASNTRVNCFGLYVCSVLYFLGFGGHVLNTAMIALVAGALWGIRDSIDKD